MEEVKEKVEIAKRVFGPKTNTKKTTKGSTWALLWFYNFYSTSSMPGNATFGKEVGASDKKFVENHFKLSRLDKSIYYVGSS